MVTPTPPPPTPSPGLYLAGPGHDVSLADFSFFPNLAYMVRLGLQLEGRYPNLLGFFQRMSTRKSILATWPPHWLTSRGLPMLRIEAAQSKSSSSTF
jgi:hypothetical protein